MKKNILTQDKVESTISIINQYLRMALHQVQTKNPKFLYYLFKGNTVEEVIDFITIRNAKSALVIDDIGLQIINRLLQEGVTDITLCLARFPKELMTTVKYIIQNSFPSIKINIIHYEEISMIQNVDLIISNPAYSAIGANITYNVKDLNYKEFINLLPANDYKRNSDKNLFNFQSDMISVPAGFEDADVTTHLARIHKDKVNDMTLDEFERSQYIDRSLDKYFEENSKRAMTTLFDTSILSAAKSYDVNTTFIIGWRDPVNKHMPYKKDVTTYLWNVKENINFAYVIEHHLNKANNSVPFGGLIFKTAAEKKNYSSFVYSKNGFRFMAKLFTAVQSDMLKTMSTYFIKVDWTRAWTVEEILADYGYTEAEIAEVMADLENFKCMEN
jgi:hypothetical protein